MSKSVLISIKPQWCELIANGEKMVEVRKTRPRIETPFKCYIYCTKGRGDCLWRWNGIWYDTQDPNHRPNRLDGKVIGEFVCDQIDEIGYSPEMHGKYISDIDDIHYVSCVDFEQMFDYLADGYGYGWHISDLVIYDKPKELSEFRSYNVGAYIDENGYPMPTHAITRPPQSWCYVEERSRQ